LSRTSSSICCNSEILIADKSSLPEIFALAFLSASGSAILDAFSSFCKPAESKMDSKVKMGASKRTAMANASEVDESISMVSVGV